MIRAPALQVLHHLKGMPQDTSPPPKFIFCILSIMSMFFFLDD